MDPKDHTIDDIYAKRSDSDRDEEAVAPIAVDETTMADWSEAEEAAVTRRLDFIFLPILGLAFFALQLDRGNMSNALTSTITTDLGVNTNQINIGQSLLSAGIVLLEIPSNIVLQKVGPVRWLTFQIIGWGLVAVFQSFITDFGGYLATRIILGLAEAGFIPGALYTMSTWYKRGESNLRVSLFFLGNLVSSALTPLIGAAILSMGDRYGVAGWRWLFIIEGLITIGIGLAFGCLIPPKVGDGRPFISFGKWSYFNQRESHILSRRVLLDDPAKARGEKIRISGRDVWETIKNPRILAHVVISTTATVPVNSINTYGPSVIKSLGFDAVHANARASVGHFVSVVLAVTLGWAADKTGRKAPFLLVPVVWSLIAFSCLLESGGWSTGRRYAAVVFAMSTNTTVHILNVGWLSINCKRPQERSVAMAMIIMAANCGGIAGSQVFRTEDAPQYVNAFTANLACVAAVAVLAIGQGLQYFFSNKRLKEGDIIVGQTEDAAAGGTVELAKPWKYTW